MLYHCILIEALWIQSSRPGGMSVLGVIHLLMT